MVTVVTTFPDDDITAKDCLESFAEYWPKRYKMTAYFNSRPPSISDKAKKRVTFLQADSIPNMTGMKQALDNEEYRRGDFYMNAYAWAQKAIVIGHTGMMTEEPFIWIDSDVITFKKIPADFIHKVLPHEIFMSILGRTAMQNPRFVPFTESGFLAFDGAHMAAKNFFSFYLNAWFTFAFKYLHGWTDCHVLDYTRHVMEVPTFDLTANLPMPCPGDHVFVHSMLGEYMDHLKGERKILGHSPEHPIKWWKSEQQREDKNILRM